MPEFLSDCADKIDSLDQAIIKMEQNPQDHQIIDEIFRIMHTLKGEAGFLELKYLQSIAHSCENVLNKIRDGKLQINSDIISIILDCIDEIKLITKSLNENQAEPVVQNKVLLKIISGVLKGSIATSNQTQVTEPEPTTEHQEQDKDNKVEQTDSQVEAQYIKVHVDTIEQLMNQISELVINRNELIQTSTKLNNEQLTKITGRLNFVTSMLQDDILKMRMQPISTIWNKLPRIIRDLCRQTGKHINLETKGQDTELDRHILNIMQDILIHLVRNCVDHGVETPEERLKSGKPKEGKISLQAKYEHNYITCIIKDDGGGMDTKKIKQKALEKGIIDLPEQFNKMSKQDLFDLIFLPGFSTSKNVSNISGRGVGLDAVKNNIEKINGLINMDSQTNVGTIFTIKIPLTLSIIEAAILSINNHKFALPQMAILEFIKITPQHTIEYINNQSVFSWSGQIIPILFMNKLFMKENSSHNNIIVIKSANSTFGIAVDQIIDTQEIVVKPLPKLLQTNDLLLGVTILGDGSAANIFDVNGLYNLVKNSHEQKSKSITNQESPITHQSSHRKVDYLLFRNGQGSSLQGLPLTSVIRIDKIEKYTISRNSENVTMVTYNDKLIPIANFNDNDQNIVFIGQENQPIAMMINEIANITSTTTPIKVKSRNNNFFGTTTIDNQAVDIIDIRGLYNQLLPDPVISKSLNELLVITCDDNYLNSNTHLLNLAGNQVIIEQESVNIIQQIKHNDKLRAIILDIDFEQIQPFDLLHTITSQCNVSIIGISGGEISPKKQQYCQEKGIKRVFNKNQISQLMEQIDE